MKEYIKPNMEVVSVKTQNPLNMSVRGLEGVNATEQKLNNTSVESRRSPIWDED
jgi:hypothetical protein